MPKPVRAVTISYKGISRILQSKVTVGDTFHLKDGTPTEQNEFVAIWDTGATSTVITNNVVKKCGLKPTGMIQMHTASGVDNCNTYVVSMMLPNDVGFPELTVSEAVLPPGSDLLIGMDIINLGDFSVSNYKGITKFTFRIPSTTHVDYVKELKQQDELARPKIGRNDPCSCGSGKKYKKCCAA